MKIKVKKLHLTILIEGLLLIKPIDHLFGQQIMQQPYETPSVYFGLGLAINDYGLGLGLEIPLSGKLSINGNAGIGGWGWKIGWSINFYPIQISNKSEFSLGYSRASGLQDFTQDLWVEPDERKQPVKLDLNVVETINLIYTYNIKIGNSFKTRISAGYAIPVTKTPYEIKTLGVVLSSTSKQVMDIMQPGGLIFGIRFMFGI